MNIEVFRLRRKELMIVQRNLSCQFDIIKGHVNGMRTSQEGKDQATMLGGYFLLILLPLLFVMMDTMKAGKDEEPFRRIQSLKRSTGLARRITR